MSPDRLHPADLEAVAGNPATGAALVVVGTRGRGRAHDAVSGSVTRAVLDRAGEPVAVVRRSTPAVPRRRQARK